MRHGRGRARISDRQQRWCLRDHIPNGLVVRTR